MTEPKKNAKKGNDHDNKHHESHSNNHSNNHSENPAMNMFKEFAQQGKTLMDRDALINNHRKNLEAMNDASKTAMDLFKSVNNLQNQYVRQTFEDFSAILRDLMHAPQSPEQWEKQAEHFKKSVTKAIDHSSNVANIVVKTNSDFYKKAQSHAKDAFQEMKYMAAAKKK